MNLFQRLVEVRKMAPYIKKDAKGFNYTYVKESTVLGLIAGAMNEHKVLLAQEMLELQSVTIYVPATKTAPAREAQGIKAKFQYTWINADDPEERFSCFQFIQDPEADAQACGSLMTYGMRYFLLKFFNVPTDNLDPDDFQKNMDKLLDDEESSETKANGTGSKPTPVPIIQIQEKISQSQMTELLAEVTNHPDLLQQIITGNKITHIADLPAKAYPGILSFVRQAKANRK